MVLDLDNNGICRFALQVKKRVFPALKTADWKQGKSEEDCRGEKVALGWERGLCLIPANTAPDNPRIVGETT